jgi:glycosyltransferase involved in cell wall biosynthesis
MNESISVIIPAYNAERYLREAMASIQAQSHPVKEIILVDDGSTDGTAALAKSMSGITVLQQANAGVAAARNTGVQAARGTLLAFLDADDEWTPDAVASNLRVLTSQPEAHGAIGLSEEFISLDVPADVAQRYAARSIDRTALFCGAMLLRREAMSSAGLFSTESAGGDFVEWFLRAQRLGICLARNPQVTLRRRIHGYNKTIRSALTTAIYLQILHEHIQALKSQS